MNKYEILFLIDPSLESSDLSNLIGEIEKILGGKIVKKDHWGKKELAYEIKKNKKADYHLYYVETNSENIFALKDMLAINKKVLRQLILRHEKKWPFEYKKTSADLKVPERKPRKEFNKKFDSTNSKSFKKDELDTKQKDNVENKSNTSTKENSTKEVKNDK